jgi:uncharacterized protein (DUF305 family)
MKGIRYVNRNACWRIFAVTTLAFGMFFSMTAGLAAEAHDATPAAPTCDSIGTPVEASHGSMEGMDMEMATAESMEIDLAYIDMMIPHHASIIALSQAAFPLLQDDRLRTMAQGVIDAQTAEIEELKGYRLELFGSADPQPVSDHAMMALMGDSDKPMDAMMTEMDANAQMAAFCAALDPDLAFIELTIPHHESAVLTSEVVVTGAEHPEIRDFAQRVIDAQQSEIEQLEQIRLELTGSATPEA